MPSNLDDSALSIDKDGIDGKAHAPRVNARARLDPQPAVWGERASPKQSFHASPGGSSDVEIPDQDLVCFLPHKLSQIDLPLSAGSALPISEERSKGMRSSA